jgi:hypothetical protein
MELMATEVMPQVEAAVGTPVAASAVL